MANPIPSSLALTTIATDAQILSSDHRNNYAALQAAVNELITALSGGTAGQLLRAASSTTVEWGNAAVVTTKTSDKAVSTAVEADLLNGEFSLAGNRLGTAQRATLRMWGDCKFNSGASQDTPRFKVKIGGSTILDTNVQTTGAGNSAVRRSWELEVVIAAKGATNAQWVSLTGRVGMQAGTTGGSDFTTGNGVVYVAASGRMLVIEGAAAATADTTADQALAVTVTTASGTNTDVTLKYAVLEIA